jgi:hypothetical protein
VARITEVVGAKAEEQGHATTVSAFEVNELFLMLFTKGSSIRCTLDHIACAFWTY